MAQPRADYDSPWKEIIEHFFPQFVAFFFPAISAEIDWTEHYEFLDKELQQGVREAQVGRHTVDKLVKVKLKDGADVWLLIHIEVQSQTDKSFARRMFVSNYRIFDRHGVEVISLGILADNRSDWRPTRFGYGRWGSEMSLQFPIVKLLDFEAKWEELNQNSNPFAVVVMAHLRAMTTKRKDRERLQWKINLVIGLSERGYKRKEIFELFRFIDWVLALSPDMEHTFRKELAKLEEKDTMQYVTSIERLALQDGIEQGMLKRSRDAVLDILKLRFNSIPSDLIDEVNALTDLAQFKELTRQAVLVGTLEEFERGMA